MKDNRIKRKLYETHTIRYNEYRQINAYIRQWIDNGKEIKNNFESERTKKYVQEYWKKDKIIIKGSGRISGGTGS